MGDPENWYTRLVDEHMTLAEQIRKLSAFLDGSTVTSGFDVDQRELMLEQLQFMRAYESTLRMRIDLAKADPKRESRLLCGGV